MIPAEKMITKRKDRLKLKLSISYDIHLLCKKGRTHSDTDFRKLSWSLW